MVGAWVVVAVAGGGSVVGVASPLLHEAVTRRDPRISRRRRGGRIDRTLPYRDNWCNEVAKTLDIFG